MKLAFITSVFIILYTSKAEQPGARFARNCGQCNCQDCKATAGPVAAPGAPAAPISTTQCTAGQCRQCRQCTPEEEKACLAMMAAARKTPAVAPKDNAGSHLYRKFKRAIALKTSPLAGQGCAAGAVANNAQCKC
ncbi:hypothetical protein M3Y99_00871000 [Aphelenchoides fujianensis]|nr:hypothetical protein M3Y99_00871000 [Aphelenchoides fujianensis]